MLLIGLLQTPAVFSQNWYLLPADTETRWSSFENPNGQKGQGGKENQGAKGHAYDRIGSHSSQVIFSDRGSGTIRRIWLTVNDRSPVMLRSLRIEMYWDNAAQPAVSAPLGDFFGIGLGRRIPFESELFSDPEGRSFNCYVPMPYRTAARIVIVNDSDQDLDLLFYDVNFLRVKQQPANMLYFHTYWHREQKTALGKDFEILPTVAGNGRFLGSNLGVIADSIYQDTWWGEGEVKMFLDQDIQYPTLIGSGTEDYIGTAWGQGQYAHRYQGSPIEDKKHRQWAFYRYHVPDPVYFRRQCRITIQQIGGAPLEKVRELRSKGAPLIPISASSPAFTKLLEMSPVPDLNDAKFPEGWINFYRQDDWSATAYFYLDKPQNNLPRIVPVRERTMGLLPGGNP
jgi:hypothetical protein